ncbi:hypothetical protein H8356DRAFT_966847, partial [Neocallimastix lanati (nom. inval.)]
RTLRSTKVTFQYSIAHVTDEFKIKVKMVDELTNRTNLYDFTTRCRSGYAINHYINFKIH